MKNSQSSSGEQSLVQLLTNIGNKSDNTDELVIGRELDNNENYRQMMNLLLQGEDLRMLNNSEDISGDQKEILEKFKEFRQISGKFISDYFESRWSQSLEQKQRGIDPRGLELEISAGGEVAQKFWISVLDKLFASTAFVFNNYDASRAFIVKAMMDYLKSGNKKNFITVMDAFIREYESALDKCMTEEHRKLFNLKL